MEKTKAALFPRTAVAQTILDDADLAGPLLFCLLLGVSMLGSGKMHFGWIYGFGATGCVSVWVVLSLLSANSISLVRTVSALGYCLLPMVLLALVSIVLPTDGVLSLGLATVMVMWCTASATNMFVSALQMHDQKALVAYPIALVYACFGLITIF